MIDITTRLRRWSISTGAVPASDLMDEAADEIDRLRLTDSEREAVKSAIWDYEQNDGDADCASMAATLRGLLERMKGDTHAV